MIKRFLIIAIFGGFTFNANLISHSLHIGKNGGAGHFASNDICPIKGACPHHSNNSQHQGHHKTAGEAFIKCDCSADYASIAAYEIVMQDVEKVIPSKSFIYNISENKQIITGIEPVPSEGPPKIFA